jgi:tetraprenyl-beta-curcumene synthase
MNSFFNNLGGLPLIFIFVKKVFPLIDIELHHWSTKVSHACPELKEQALSSIKDKRFHCQGGSIYSLYPTIRGTDFISLVVALQTISDYLDNLCDNAGIIDEQAFWQLHQAMSDALDPNAIPHDYYAFYPYKQDGDYLRQLVLACQQQVRNLPSYELVKPQIQKVACLYSSLQTYKHLDPTIRDEKMLTWIDPYLENYPQITHWEFTAATGSTLGMFMLCAAANDKNLTPQEVENISSAYFPWICGLHILLDYFIDAVEDQERGDLNFVAYYADAAQELSRLTLFVEQALLQASLLPHPAFHKLVVQGLLAMYLSDPKANGDKQKKIKHSLLKTAGGYTKFLYQLCKVLRYKKKL